MLVKFPRNISLFLSRLFSRIVCFFIRHRPVMFLISGETYCSRCGSKL